MSRASESPVQLFVNVDVADLERAVAFYTRGLGLGVRRRVGGEIVELEGAGAPVFLMQQAAGSAPFQGAREKRAYARHWTPVHLDFVVSQLEPAILRAEAAGAETDGEIREFAAGRYRVMADPFGNGFCLLELEGEGYAALEAGAVA